MFEPFAFFIGVCMAIIGIIINKSRCKHDYETIRTITINDRTTGNYMHTIYHQECDKCNKLKKVKL